MYDMTGPFNAGINAARNLNAAYEQQQQLAEQNRAALATEAMRQQQLDQNSSRDQATQQHQTLADQLAVIGGGGQQVQNGAVQQPVAPSQPSNGDTPLTAIAQSAMPSSVNVPAAPGRTVSVAGQQYQMPTQQESGDADLAQKVKVAQALQNVKGRVRLGESIATPLGFDPNMEVPVESVGSLSEAAERAKKPGPKYQFHYETNDDGTVNAFRTDDAGNVIKAGTFRGAAGTKAGSTDPDAPPDKRTAAAITQHDKLFDQENVIHALRGQLGSDITLKDGDEVTDPWTKQTMPMTAAKRTFYQQQVDKLGTQAKDIESQRQQLRQNFKLGEYAPAQPGAAATAQPRQVQQVQKVATPDQLQRYATQKKIPLAQAAQEFKAAGYNTTPPPPAGGN